MVIGVDDSLNSLYYDLKAIGYSVYRLSENMNYDIVVYSGTERDLAILNSSLSTKDDSGVFIINGDNKSCSEVISMINSRSYSSLF